jgi:hypothetical protein
MTLQCIQVYACVHLSHAYVLTSSADISLSISCPDYYLPITKPRSFDSGFGQNLVSTAEALATRRAGKEIASEYPSDSNSASSYYSDSSYELDFGSDSIKSESDINTNEEPLSGPATGLVITSTPADRFVYWPERERADPTDDNSCCINYHDTLPFQKGPAGSKRQANSNRGGNY